MPLAATRPLPTDILDYYRGCPEALDSLKTRLTPSLAGGIIAGPSRFVGMTPVEFEEALSALRGEPDCQVVMMLVASVEAVFQADLRDRVSGKKKGTLSKALRRWHKEHYRRREAWINLESLLEAWKKTVSGRRQTIGRLKSLLLFRHWLAHGRYWSDKSGLGKVDPYLAWQIGKAVFDALPEFSPLPSL